MYLTIDIVNGHGTFDSDTGAIECHKNVKTRMLALSVVDVNESFNSSVDNVSNFITNCNNTIVKVKQNYKNKTTLISFMQKYSIHYKFNFRVERSNKMRYSL